MVQVLTVELHVMNLLIQPRIQWATAFFPGGKVVDISYWSCSAEVKNVWSCTSTPPICLQGMNSDKFTFNLLIY
jgi:hypothetical protein